MHPQKLSSLLLTFQYQPVCLRTSAAHWPLLPPAAGKSNYFLHFFCHKTDRCAFYVYGCHSGALVKWNITGKDISIFHDHNDQYFKMFRESVHYSLLLSTVYMFTVYHN